MILEHTFTVEAPLGHVWEMLLDVERVALCLPGAEMTATHGEGSGSRHEGRMRVKLGPMSLVYSGEVEILEADGERRWMTLRASGRERRGQGAAKATIASALSETGGGTEVRMRTDLQLSGRAAQVGRAGMMQDVSNQLLAQFADCLRSALAADGASGEGSQAADRGPEAPQAADERADAQTTAPPARGHGRSRAARSGAAAGHVTAGSLMLAALRGWLRRLRDRVRPRRR